MTSPADSALIARRVAELEAALRPFAEHVVWITQEQKVVKVKDVDVWNKDGMGHELTFGDFRKARAALGGAK